MVEERFGKCLILNTLSLVSMVQLCAYTKYLAKEVQLITLDWNLVGPLSVEKKQIII